MWFKIIRIRLYSYICVLLNYAFFHYRFNSKSKIYEAECNATGCSGLTEQARAVPILINIFVNQSKKCYEISVGCTCINESMITAKK